MCYGWQYEKEQIKLLQAGGIPAEELTTDYTALAYNGDTDINAPQIYDIALLQLLYGANTSYNSGDTNYSFNNGYSAIWDGGGNDTFNASAYGGGVALDIRSMAVWVMILSMVMQAMM